MPRDKPPAWESRTGRIEYVAIKNYRRVTLGMVVNTIDADTLERRCFAQVLGGPKVSFANVREAMQWGEASVVLALED